MSDPLDPISSLRREYASRQLDVPDVDADPLQQFRRWFDEATDCDVVEPNAMVLSTVSERGRPAARVVLLKGVDDSGFVFYTNMDSRKGRELATTPFASLTFWWAPLERQVRIEGHVAPVAPEISDRYFASRPRASQLGAIASPQSATLLDRSALEHAFAAAEATYQDQPITRPERWGGYALTPELVEFWQGRRSRLHDRIVYTKIQDSWDIRRLAP